MEKMFVNNIDNEEVSILQYLNNQILLNKGVPLV
jgi:hypothetical protein